ncbi:hypothetical protein BE17_47975 [Sorangium cellulosum]|uniref:Right handed beta helix domain-containing protein n=1 Tax=Sorangium cellulosum TaxID=56 RepID=A0A150QY81_SORCE|nr:hypothetical protein BE17_47975 [Sorangium cellulosum]
MPPQACGPGFEADGQAGCMPVLPEGPCPRGQMAIPGEARCREVTPCGTGDYGAIPRQDDATTQFVNAAYAGDDSDGTRARPWKRIQDGIRFASSAAVVAVAAGSYEEDLLIQHRPVQVWGRCPALVEVVGAVTESAALRINSRNASRSEVHSLAITGPGAGIITAGSRDVVADRLWIHDTMDFGIGTEDSAGETSIAISASLIEATRRFGVIVAGSDVTIEATSVRATRPYSDERSENGHGVNVNYNAQTARRPKLTLRASVVEQNHEAGVVVSGADATIDATVVRDTLQRSDGRGGHGISIEHAAPYERAKVTLQRSHVERNHGFGVFVVGSDATVDATVVRSTQPDVDGTGGVGILAAMDPATRERAALTLRSSLLDQNHNNGVNVLAADAEIEATVVRATQPRSDGSFGRGISISKFVDLEGRSTASIRGSLVEQNHDVGVMVIGGDTTIEGTVVRATRSKRDGTFGDGIAVASNGDDARAIITSTMVEDNARAGISNFSAAVLLVSSTVRCNKIDLNGEDEIPDRPFTFDGSTENLVGCGATLSSEMVVRSAHLTAPQPIDSTDVTER